MFLLSNIIQNCISLELENTRSRQYGFQIEILPLWKIYLDENKKKTGDGFKLYTSYHLGYHVPLFKNRLFLEPQIHCNYWPIDSKRPQGFEEKEIKWSNYFLFQANLYIGVNF